MKLIELLTEFGEAVEDAELERKRVEREFQKARMKNRMPRKARRRR